MLDFFKTFFRPVPPSGTTAKERLRLVLLSDHLSLAPDVVESLKRDLLEVISRYVEIDPAHADVTFEQRESEVAMLASIPITGVRERPRAPVYEPVPQPLPLVEPEPLSLVEPEEEASGERVDEQGEPVGSAHPARSANGKPPRRRRRRKKASGNAALPSKSLATGSA